ncbi:hypothetical protein I5E68_09630 [Novosphingobium sp. YJ-S2-02]|uniref:Uncharacterized protein n=1 Tax=Novosphingobium aureum TaxID=2792964 RepID=A0A931HBX6_9SPHN|nr:hypothetical protein [Novosphingobium aureum]MBH0113205.1 hypothetical protein [Novosphingobium aureum]
MTAKVEQTSRFEDGREAVDDATPTSSVRILEPRQQTPKQGGFRIYVLNSSDKPFNFGPENITVKMPDGTSVAMLTYQDLLKQQKRREAWQALAVGLAAAGRNMQANQAGYNYGSATYSGNSYGTFGTMPYTANSYGTATYSGYNAGTAFAAQSVANEQNQRDLQAMRLSQAAKREDLAQVMKMTTIDPEQVFGGIVQYKIPSEVRASKTPVPITIEVRTGDEVHTFQATLAKYKG